MSVYGPPGRPRDGSAGGIDGDRSTQPLLARLLRATFDLKRADDLPTTRSGTIIMRRLLRDIAEGKQLGDVTTLRDPEVVKQLQDAVK